MEAIFLYHENHIKLLNIKNCYLILSAGTFVLRAQLTRSTVAPAVFCNFFPCMAVVLHGVLSLLACSDVGNERYCSRSALHDVIRHGLFLLFRAATTVFRDENCSSFDRSSSNTACVTGFI